jgi:hypothetical protein
VAAKLIEVVLILVGSAFKYSFSTVFAADSSLGTIAAFTANFLGGVWGVLCFTYLEDKVKIWYIKRRKNSGNYKAFTRWNKLLVKLRRRFGLKGIAFLTPIILTIPVGVAISLTLTHDKAKIVKYILISCFFWTSVILLPYKLLHIDISEWVLGWFN